MRKKGYVNRIKANINIYSRNKTNTILDGSYRSIFKGRSMNFEDLREYVVGDNVKDIDWKSSSRHRKLLIKQYIAERKHNVLLVLDTHRKMFADSADGEQKKEIALYTAGTVGYIALKNGDSVGTIFNHNNSLEYFPFKGDVFNLEYMLAKYEKEIDMDNVSDLNNTLVYIKKHIKSNAIIFIISDLDGMDNIDSQHLKELSYHHDILFVNISDYYLHGKEVYDIDNNSYIPKLISGNNKLFELEMDLKEQLYSTCINKMSKHKIASVTIDNTKDIVKKVVELLEEHKYVSSR